MKTRVQIRRTQRRLFQRMSMTLVAIVCVLWPYMFSAANTGTTFTLNNRTRYYLHANVNNETFVYVAPGGSVIVEVTAPTSVNARVRYSPGQTIKGAGERTVDINETVTSSNGSSTCTSNSQGGNDCSTTEPSTSASATPGRWDVLPTDLTAE